MLLFLVILNQTLKAQINIQSTKDPYALHTYYHRTYRSPQGTWSSNMRKRIMAHSFWKEDSDAEGKARIQVDLASQIVRFYKGDEVIGQAPISSGMEGYETKAGDYTILAKEVEHFSNLYGEFVDRNGRVVGYGKATDVPPRGTHYKPSPMPFFLRLDHGGLGLHAGYLPGYPASHGCIRLPHDMAKHFFNAASIGMPVEVVD